jgi:hypothetical protein
VRVTFDHQHLVSDHLGAPDGSNLSIWYVGGASPVQVHRVLDPESAWGQVDTAVWFPLVDSIAGNTSAAYELRVNAPMQELDDPSEVFHFADFFDRADADDPGAPWVVTESAQPGASLVGGALQIDTIDESNRPIAEVPFPLHDRGLELHMGFRFVRNASELTYRMHMQLGHGESMVTPTVGLADTDAQGVGPHVVYAGLNQPVTTTEESVLVETTTGFVEVGTLTAGRLVVQAVTQLGAYRVFLDGAQRGGDIAYPRAIPGIDRLRLVAWEIGGNMTERAFDWVFVRRLNVTEPTASYVDSCPFPP